VVAAARSNLEASRQTQSEIEARMLATARMLVELDRHHVLNQDTLDEIVRENSLFRVTVYGSDREQQLASASDVGQRRGFGPGFAFGFGGDLFDLLLGGILAVVALLATFVPSWRAPRVDPMTNAAENE
jgi:hypothetical protein